MSLSFYLFFCTYHFFFFVLISSLRPIFCPSSTSSSSFHGNLSFFLSRSQSDHLPSQASFSSFSSNGQITYPPQAPISTTRTTRIKTHKHGLRRPTSTNPQALKPILVNPQVPISTADTDPQASRPIFIDPRTLI